MTAFSDFKLNKQLLTAIADQGWEAPTPIQEKAIPQILAGHDILGVAQTGTGKTAAYVLPILMKVKYAQGEDPRALILVPTRELVIQVADWVKALGKNTDLRTVALYGGVGVKPQAAALEAGCDIIVATPGRLMDLYLPGHVSLKKITTMVLDEAERLLDMGFRPQIGRILEVVPRKRQNMLFSATFGDRVKRISEEFLVAPMEIRIEERIRPARSVTQSVYFTPNLKTKINLLGELLATDGFDRVILFCKTKETATNIARYLSRKYGEETVRVIHGNKAQNTRLNAVEQFRRHEVRFLVSTDVAARGIDIPSVTHVFNFDVPLVYEDYVHRVGRTGRAFETGAAITFCAPDDEYHLRKIQKLIGEKIPVVSLPERVEVPETPFEEQQRILREIDMQRRKEDPTYQGAFHERKRKSDKTKKRRS
ncbi:MAG: DEAD/DEAH box helicase [Candidatus Pollutiaquabacter aromativorans]